MNYAFVQDGNVIEVIVPFEGLPIEEQVHPDVLKGLIACDADVRQGWVYTDGAFADPPEPVVTAEDLTSHTAASRYLLEVGGFEFQGHLISTDRDSQSKIGNVALAAQIVGPPFSISFKCSDGTFFALDQSTAIEMATAIMTFVSGCFDAEAAIVAAIAAGSVKTFADIDSASWPENH